MDIFKITLWTVNSIVKKHKIDSFIGKGKLQINAKDFYKAYIGHFNPSLFEVWEKKKKVKPDSLKVSNSDIFQKLFGSAHKIKVKRRVEKGSLISADSFTT